MLDQTTLIGIFGSVVVAGAGVFWKWVRDELKQVEDIPRLKTAVRVIAQAYCKIVEKYHPVAVDNLEKTIDKILQIGEGKQ